jgi:hypothetical protein
VGRENSKLPRIAFLEKLLGDLWPDLFSSAPFINQVFLERQERQFAGAQNQSLAAGV